MSIYGFLKVLSLAYALVESVCGLWEPKFHKPVRHWYAVNHFQLDFPEVI
jgi:hypothetical protein